ncbi:MAG: histidine phosphatase family protein [Hyphomicrobiales bacterium]
MTLYLVRHGKAAAGVEDLDPGLDEAGRAQAEAAARALQDTNTRRLIVSPMRRTRETALPIAEALACETIVRVEVAEVYDPNMPIEERRNMIGPFMAGRWTGQPQALLDWRQRVVDTLVELGKEADAASEDLVVVSHYIAISVAIGEALGDDRVVPVPMANASITTMRLGPGGLELVEAASTAHLPPELVTGIGQAMAGR